ncbi:MAG: NFACT family protein [Armatimonadota bacterium]
MVVDSTALARLVAEAADYAVGVRVRRIVQPRHDLIALELGRAGPWACLLIDWSAEYGRLHLAGELPPPALREQRFGAVLRRQLWGARIDAIEQIDFDRLVRMRFSNCEQLGPHATRTLIAELMGRHSNLVLLGEDERIVEAGRHVTARVNRYRETLPGLTYVPPPDFGRIPPWRADPAAMADAAQASADQPLGRWLRASFHGCSDPFVAEVCARVGVPEDVALRDLPPGWPERVVGALWGIQQEAGRLGAAWVYYDAEGERPELAWPVQALHLAGRRRERVESLSAAVAELQALSAQERTVRQVRQRLLAAVRAGMAKAERVLEKRWEAVAQAERAELDRERGQLLMAYLHEVPEGASEVALPRFSGEGELSVALDPQRSALENAQAYFRRYKKSARLSDMAPRLLAAARHELEYLRQAGTQIETAEDLADLLLLEEELLREGYLSTRPADGGRPPQRPAPRTAHTADGYPLLYGRSGTENDEVLRAAQGDDLWLHVKDAAGPHVVIRTDGRPDQVPEETIKEAARLAASLSSRRLEGKVEVDCTLAKNVTKPRRGRPGLAYYRGAHTIVVDLS